MNPADDRHESAKQRALRIPLDYVGGRDDVLRFKWLLSFAAAAVTLAYIGWALWGGTGAKAFSHGPLANVHATWDQTCAACHVDFVYIRDDAANPLAKLGLVSPPSESLTDLPLHHRANHKCETCHAGPPHHARQKADEVGTCASCHAEHRGRNADIARPADSACTRCHENIKQHLGGSGTSQFTPDIEPVLRFDAAPVRAKPYHPEFRSLNIGDPGNIKFNHQIHMTLGIPAADPQRQGKPLLTLADLPAEFVARKQLPKRSSNDFVQLACTSCHRLEAADARSAATGHGEAPAPGEYMLPVNFENDCRACHPLNYEPVAGKEIKHGLRPAEAREFLFGRYVFESKSGKLAESATRLVPPRPIPGRSPDVVSPHHGAEVIDSNVAAAERYLRDTNACSKCHLVKTSDAASNDFALPDVEPANIPHVWLRHARFDHAAHRAVDCTECHSAAWPSLIADELLDRKPDHEAVMIAGRDVCLKCHSPRSASGPVGGARFDCVECHRYHGADDSPSWRWPIDKFLQGVVHPTRHPTKE